MSISNNTDKQLFLNITELIVNRFEDTFIQDNIKGIYIKKLTESDIISENKINRSGNTSHIACTGPAMHFFYEIIGSLSKTNSSVLGGINASNSTFPVYVESLQEEKMGFVESKCTIWTLPKQGGNQIGLSKKEFDGEDFYKLREAIEVGDFIIFFKYLKNNKIDIYSFKIKKEEELFDVLGYDESSTQGVRYYEVLEDALFIDTNSDLIGYNKIFYGAPGSGKSHTVKEKYEQDKTINILFHSEYTYADFIGHIKPVIRNNNSKETLIYEFVNGPFTTSLINAFNNSDSMHYLVIDEINRANAPSVFGDIFQLLDRNENGYSEYTVYNKDIYDALVKNVPNYPKEMKGSIYIPNNLSIIGTMNNSDQNTFVFDTAFKRRWKFEHIPISFNNHCYKDTVIPMFSVTWEQFVTEVNAFMFDVQNRDLMITEDKQIGQYFATKSEIVDSNDFSYKVLLYLWDDVFKYERNRIFEQNINTFEKLVTEAKEKGLNIFISQLKSVFESIVHSNSNINEQ